MNEGRKDHWEQVYATRQPEEVSWYQPVPKQSLGLIEQTGVDRDEPVLDAGGGASTLVDQLLQAGFTDVTVLDISAAALERSRARLGDNAQRVTWVETDVTRFDPDRWYALWHDRAVFHFLVDATDRSRYRDVVQKALRPQGHLVLSTFGPEGPRRCSGLDICRYDVELLGRELGENFTLRSHLLDEHETPGGATQQFLYTRWQLNGKGRGD